VALPQVVDNLKSVKTLLVGNFGDHNLGDELILLAALREYPRSVVMTNDPQFSQTFTEQSFETLPFPPMGVRSWWTYLTNEKYRKGIQQLAAMPFQQIVFAGGGLFAIRWRACWLWWRIFRFLKRNHSKVTIRFEHQGIDKNLGVVSRWLAKKTFRQADFVSVRDEESGQALDKMRIENYEVSRDRVWEWLKKSKVGSVKGEGPLIIINALSSFDIEPIEKKYPKHRLVFVPFALSDLRAVPDDFAHEIIWPKTKTELFDLLIQADALIGERFHSIVCGYHFCGPEKTFTLRAPYSEKVDTFCKKHGVRPVV